MKIALSQFSSIFMDIDKNNMQMVEDIKSASENDVDIIVFPECFSTGYSLSSMNSSIEELAKETSESTIKLACEYANKHSIYVVAPIIYYNKNKLYNSAVIIDSSGKVINIYNKNHLWDEERLFFEAGDNDYRVYKTPFGNFGVIICYDVDFPETCRTLALKGADVILIPAAWASNNKSLWDIFLPARALENTVFVAGVNLACKEGDTTFFGDSKAFDPTGKLIARAKENEKELLIFDVDIEEIDEIRKTFPYLKDRRAGDVKW